MFAFQGLDIYQMAKKLVIETYSLTNDFPCSEKYCLVSQINKAAISVPSNIAESYGRKTVKDRQYFLNIARGSLFELICQMEISYELSYITKSQYENLEKIFKDLSIKISNYKKYLERNNY